jgi:hypothetical protein
MLYCVGAQGVQGSAAGARRLGGTRDATVDWSIISDDKELDVRGASR